MKRFLLVGMVLLSAACDRPMAGCPSAPAELAVIRAPRPDIAPVPVATPDSTLQLLLNIPSYRVDVLVAGALRTSYPVAVGTSRYPTRTGDFHLQSITWNPWWLPPASPWARDEKLTPPGPGNPMGKVKLNYSPNYFLHGTPDSLRLQRPASHGCVRLRNQDAIELAQLVHAFTGTAPADTIQQQLLSSWRTTRTIPLPPTVQLSVTYQLAEVRDTLVYVFQDIYRTGQRRTHAIGAALARAGRVDAQLDSAALRRFLAPERSAIVIHVDSLLRTR